MASVIINYYHKGLKRERESKQTNWEQTFLENSLKTFKKKNNAMYTVQQEYLNSITVISILWK